MKLLGACLVAGLLCGAAVMARPAREGARAPAEKPKGPPEKVVAAWTKAGAKVGWMGVDSGLGLVFWDRPRKGDVPAFSPAFSFEKNRPEGGWEKLPLIEQPFGVRLASFSTKDADLKGIAAHKQLQSLSLFKTTVTDAGLKEVAGLKKVQSLNLGFTQVKDAGLKELAGFEKLEYLDLTFTKVTDAGLKELAGLKRLKSLDLSFTKVTDVGLKELAGLKQLKRLVLAGVKVTPAGKQQLQKALPGLMIY